MENKVSGINEDIRSEGTDLNTVLMAEADELPLELEVPDDVTTIQQRITKASSSETREVGIPLSQPERPDLLYSINRYLFVISVLLGTLVVVAMTTMIIVSFGLR